MNVVLPTVCLLIAVAAIAFFTQQGVATAQASPHICERIAVSEPSQNPGLLADCGALLAIRDTLRGGVRLNWAADSRMEQWEGVGITGSPLRVTSLELSDKHLDGRVPVKMSELSELRHLDLENNRLSGGIPAKLGKLSKLETLKLGFNQLSGGIPAKLGSLSKLTGLSLHGNSLSGGIPASLGSLSALKYLWLDGNNLEGCIPGSLRSLNLTRAAPNNLPAGLSRSSLRIESEIAWCNGAASLGPATGTSSALMCEAGRIGRKLQRNCSTLLKIKDTLRGKGALNWAASVDIESWDGVTVDGSPLRITRLNLKGQGLNGKIPKKLANLDDLTRLNLSDNSLSGSIPPKLGNMKALKVLKLEDNELEGCIPKSLRGLSWLGKTAIDALPVNLGLKWCK